MDAPASAPRATAGMGWTTTDECCCCSRSSRTLPQSLRGCQYRVTLVLARPDGSEELAEGTCAGSVAFEPAGSNGFGYDPVVYIPRFGRTVAQLSAAEKDAISHRGQAARRMAELMREAARAGAAS